MTKILGSVNLGFFQNVRLMSSLLRSGKGRHRDVACHDEGLGLHGASWWGATNKDGKTLRPVLQVAFHQKGEGTSGGKDMIFQLVPDCKLKACFTGGFRIAKAGVLQRGQSAKLEPMPQAMVESLIPLLKGVLKAKKVDLLA